DVALLAAVADSVDTAMYWQPPDAVDQALAHADVAAALRPVAQAATGAPGARWWSGGVELDAQRYVQPVGESGKGLVLSQMAGRRGRGRALRGTAAIRSGRAIQRSLVVQPEVVGGCVDDQGPARSRRSPARGDGRLAGTGRNAVLARETAPGPPHLRDR